MLKKFLSFLMPALIVLTFSSCISNKPHIIGTTTGIDSSSVVITPVTSDSLQTVVSSSQSLITTPVSITTAPLSSVVTTPIVTPGVTTPVETPPATPPSTSEIKFPDDYDYSVSGDVVTDTENPLKLRISWIAAQNEGDEEIEIRLQVFIEYYDFYIGQRVNNKLKLGDKVFVFSMDKISEEENVFHSTFLTQVETKMPHVYGQSDEFELSCSIYFGGNYAGEAIEYIQCSGKIIINN